MDLTEASEQLEKKVKWTKRCLCIVNVIFILTAAMLIATGVTLYESQTSEPYFSKLSPTATLLITSGVAVSIVAILGFYGALKQSTCMILSFAFILLLMLILELSTSVFIYCNSEKIVEMLESLVKENMDNYWNDASARKNIDFWQTNFGCCGIYGPRDWNVTIKSVNDNLVTITGWLPNSCIVKNLIKPQQYNTLNVNGCLDKLNQVFEPYTYLIVLIALIIVVQTAGIMLAFSLGFKIRQQKTEQEMLKWQKKMNSSNEGETVKNVINYGCLDNEYVSPALHETP